MFPLTNTELIIAKKRDSKRKALVNSEDHSEDASRSSLLLFLAQDGLLLASHVIHVEKVFIILGILANSSSKASKIHHS